MFGKGVSKTIRGTVIATIGIGLLIVILIGSLFAFKIRINSARIGLDPDIVSSLISEPIIIHPLVDDLVLPPCILIPVNSGTFKSIGRTLLNLSLKVSLTSYSP